MNGVVVLQMLAVALGLVALFVVAKRWATARPPAAQVTEPHATFDAPDADDHGEALLTALVAALRTRGVVTNPVEPEDYGCMTVVEIDGEDVILQLGAGGEQEWLLLVKAPSGKVAPQIVDALASLADVRNVTWSLS